MDAAVSYKHAHPRETLRSVAERFEVPASSLHYRLNNTHAPRGHQTPRNLSIVQEDALIDKINAYAERGTLLTPRHITQLAQALSERDLGRNWTTTFLHRHKDRVSSRFYRHQDLARIKADTPANRAAFLGLVGCLQ